VDEKARHHDPHLRQNNAFAMEKMGIRSAMSMPKKFLHYAHLGGRPSTAATLDIRGAGTLESYF